MSEEKGSPLRSLKISTEYTNLTVFKKKINILENV